MKDYLELFRQYLTQTKKVSVNTQQSYLHDLSVFSEFFARQKVTDLATVSQEQLNFFLERMRVTGRTEASMNRLLSTLRCYYGFLHQQGIVSENPVRGIHRGAAQKKMPEILTQDEMERLLAQPDISEQKGCRDKAMLEVLYATGLRVSELCELKISDFNHALSSLFCGVGTAHERLVPIYPAAAKALTDYEKRVRPFLIEQATETALFTNMNGKKMTRQGVWKIIKSYAEQAGILKDITPHTMRHSFAVHLLENGVELDTVQEMMGHLDIASTQTYAQLLKNHFVDLYQKHPRAKTSLRGTR